jgi:hypothetical protein
MEKKIIATMSLTNTMGIGITDIDTYEETVNLVVMNGDNKSKEVTRKLHYDENGDIYFNVYGVTLFLDDFVRTDLFGIA